MIFISFSFLIAPSRTSSKMLKCESEHPHFVPNLMGKRLSFSPLGMTLVVGFSKMLFMKLKKFPSISSLLRL